MIPKYRDAKGRFRRETDEEYGEREGQFALTLRKQNRVMARTIAEYIAETNPWLDLLKKKTFA